MMDDELIKIWQSSSNQERVKFEKSRLMIDVQSSLDRLHKAIKYRDLREIIAAMVVIPVFTFYTYTIPFTLSKIASVLIILWTIYVVIRLIKTKKSKPSAFTESYLEYLYKTREYLNVQKQLLDTVLYWYILPCIALMFLFLMGFIGIPEKVTYIIITGTSGVALGIIVYFLNKRAVRKSFLPRLEKVEELLKVLEE